MSYRAYNIETTRYLTNHPKVRTNHESFASAAAAKAAITREAKRGVIVASEFAVAETTEFHKSIEKTTNVRSIMAKPGDPDIIQAVNTPRACDPSSELYWTM